MEDTLQQAKTAFIHLFTRKEEWYVNFSVEILTKYKTIAVIATRKSLVGLGMTLIIMG